jgi:hypothetical protein
MSVTKVMNPGEAVDLDKLLSGVGQSEDLTPWKPGDPLAVLVWGKEGSGKTHFAFTAPGPIVLFDFECNTAETMRAFPEKEGHIRVYRYLVPQMGAKDAAVAVADRFLSEYHAVMDKLRMANVKATIVIDSATLAGDLLTYAYVPLDNNGRAVPRSYGKRNNSYRALFQKARAMGHRLILTGRAAKDWAENAPLTTFHADVIDSTLFDTSVQVEVATNPQRTPDGKHVANRVYQIRRCKVNEKLEGLTLPALTYSDLATAIESYT